MAPITTSETPVKPVKPTVPKEMSKISESQVMRMHRGQLTDLINEFDLDIDTKKMLLGQLRRTVVDELFNKDEEEDDFDYSFDDDEFEEDDEDEDDDDDDDYVVAVRFPQDGGKWSAKRYCYLSDEESEVGDWVNVKAGSGITNQVVRIVATEDGETMSGEKKLTKSEIRMGSKRILEDATSMQIQRTKRLYDFI